MSHPGMLERAVLLAGVRRRLRWPADRAGALEALRRHAVRRSPLLADRLAGLDAAPLTELPVLTKDDLVERFEELVTDRSLRRDALQRHVDTSPPGTSFGRYRVGISSGSSGRPVLLPADGREWAGKLANSARAQSLTGASSMAGPRRVARVASPSAWHLSTQVGTTLADPRRPTLRIPATTPVEELVVEVERFRPTVVNGYASILGVLAAAQLDGRIKIAPSKVLSSGEPLGPTTRSAIVEAWGVSPHDQYATTEAGFVAAECDAHDGMHVLEDDVVVEVVDAVLRPVPPGEPGEAVLVTVLASRTVPLVRYRLDDVATVLEGPCRCGRTAPRLRLAGPVREPVDVGGGVEVHPVVVTQVLDRLPVTGWQVHHGNARLDVVVAGPRAGFDAAAVQAELQRTIARAGGTAPVSVAVAAALDPAPGGKAARFRRRS